MRRARRSAPTRATSKREEVRWRTRDRRRSPWSTRCASASTPPSAALLTEYRGLDVGRDRRAAPGRCARPAASTRSTRTPSCASPPASSASSIEELLTGPTAIAFVTERPTAPRRRRRRGQGAQRTSPRATRPWWSRAACWATSPSAPTRPGPWPTCAPREVLLAKLAGAIAAPMQQFAGLLEAVPRNFAYGLKALIDSRAAPPEPRADEPCRRTPTPLPTQPADTEAPTERGSRRGARRPRPRPLTTTPAAETAPDRASPRPTTDPHGGGANHGHQGRDPRRPSPT